MTRPDEGQALIESILLGLLLLVPVVWGLVVLADLHRAALASTAAAREAGFDAARATDLATANDAVERSVRLAFQNHGLDPSLADVDWSAPDGLERAATVNVDVAYSVAVVRIPFISGAGGPSVWVRSSHVVRIDPFGSRP